MAVGTPFSFPSLCRVYASIPGPISHMVQPLFTVYLPYPDCEILNNKGALLTYLGVPGTKHGDRLSLNGC